MIKNYLIIAYRNLLKNKLFSIINIAGLAIGLAACLLILQYVIYEFGYDKFHDHADRIYRIQYNNYQNGQQSFACAAAVPAVGPALKDNFPEILEYARFFPVSGIMTYVKPDGSSVAFREEKMQVASPSALKMFSFRLLSGNPETALTGGGKIVISESAALRYFGKDDPMGKRMIWEDNDEFIVTGIMEDVPDQSHIKFDFLISYQTLNNMTDNQSETSWGWYDFNTYVLLSPGADQEQVQEKWDKWLEVNRGGDWEKYNYRQEFILQPLADIHLYSNLLQESEPEEQGDGDAVFFLLIIAGFILMIAWVNYVNLSTARAMRRAGEVGVRKALGALRKQLVVQFIFESVLLNLVASAVAIVLIILAMPYLAGMTGRPLAPDMFLTSWFWITLTLLFVAGALLSGLYPAFILSSFRPVSVLKGKINTSRKGIVMRKGLVIFQFGASVALIAGTLIVYKQIDFMMKQDLGVDINRTLVLRGPGITDSLYTDRLNTFKIELLKNTEISKITASTNVPGNEIFWTRDIKRLSGGPENGVITYNVGIDYDYLSTFGLKVIAGRNFSQAFPADRQSVLINESVVKILEFDDAEKAINEYVNVGGDTLQIVGVLADYHQMSLKSEKAPIVFRLTPDANRFYALKIGGIPGTLSLLEEKWKDFFPGNPFEYFFLDEFFNIQYRNDRMFGQVFSVFSILAIFIACLGLTGLATFMIVQRTKEIGIRKVFGASVNRIVYLLAGDYVKIILLANIIALPVAYLVMDNWLSNYPFRIGIHWWMLLLPTLIVMVVALLTISVQTVRAALINPANSLRYE